MAKKKLRVPLSQGSLDFFIQASYPAAGKPVMCGVTKASCSSDRLGSKCDSCVTRDFFCATFFFFPNVVRKLFCSISSFDFPTLNTYGEGPILNDIFNLSF